MTTPARPPTPVDPGTDTHLVQDLEGALDAAPPGPLARRAVPRELLQPATAAGLLRISLEECALLAVMWFAMTFVPWWLVPVLWVGIAGRFHALGVVLHDAAHMPLRGKSLTVRLVEVLCGYPMATTINAMRYHHLRHHRDSGMETDPYFKEGEQTALWWTLHTLRGALLLPFWTVRAIVGVIAIAVPALRTPYARIFLQDRSGVDLRDSREVYDCARAEIGQLLFQAALVVALIVWPQALVLGYVVPMVLATVLAANRLLREHEYERTSDRRMETIIATTRDHSLGLAGRLLLAPRNIGLHIVHHLHPQVGLTALPMLRAWYLRNHPGVYPDPRPLGERDAKAAR
jgi:fatty acid desaturase